MENLFVVFVFIFLVEFGDKIQFVIIVFVLKYGWKIVFLGVILGLVIVNLIGVFIGDKIGDVLLI